MSGKRTLSLSAYKKSKQALAVAPAKKERRLGFGESVSTREVRLNSLFHTREKRSLLRAAETPICERSS